MSFIAASAIIGGAGLLSGVGGMIGGNKAAGASLKALGAEKDIQNYNFHSELPFLQGGTQAIKNLDYLLGVGSKNYYAGKGVPAPAGGYGSLLKPFTTADWKQLSPMYNFELQQGEQGVLNGDTSGVGALSGAAAKDLIGYNQGLASTSFGQAFDMYNTQQGNIYNRLMGIVDTGQAAAAGQAGSSTNMAGNLASTYGNIGNAQANAASSFGNSLGNVGSQIGWLNAYANMPKNTTATGV